ncbi:MAG: corrinoid protein [Chloroflexi bacterium]|nr:corrinoid protein [Chloroflexota bacterium]
MIKSIYKNILAGNSSGVTSDIEQALASGQDAGVILNQGMIAAMEEVGQLYESGEYFVPEMLIAARAMQKGLAILKPHLMEDGIEPVGKAIIGTVKGDLHDIGKNLVGMMLEGNGFEVIDLGVDVGPEQFVEAVRENTPCIVGLSALLTTTMPGMQRTIDQLDEAGLGSDIRVMVGGAPVTQVFAEGIGADGYALDASSAVSQAKALIKSMNG